MRVLQISHNHHVAGGSDRVFFETSSLLQEAGHEVIPFCTESARNLPSDWTSYFPRAADTGAPRLRDAARYFYNTEARDRLRALLQTVGPIDVAHLHIYHGKMTAAILPALKSFGIPIVHSLHEYKMACPVYTMERQGRTCDACISGNWLNGLRYRCKDGSVVKSAVMVAEMALSRGLGDVRLVDRFICVSEFQREVMIRAGLPAKRLATLHNFTRPVTAEPGHDGYLLYAGRIERLKGLSTLLDAVAETGHPLLIAGEGSWVPDLVARISSLPQVAYLGFCSGAQLSALISRARAIVVPSEWNENCPMTVLEAKAMGRPVIASRIGGIPELVRDGIDGVLFDPGDAAALAVAFRRFANLDHGALSAEASADLSQRFRPEVHLEKLLRIYRDAGAQISTQSPSHRAATGAAQRITV